jgi:hypothetical protein
MPSGSDFDSSALTNRLPLAAALTGAFENVEQIDLDVFEMAKLLLEPHRFNNTVRFLNNAIRKIKEKAEAG